MNTSIKTTGVSLSDELSSYLERKLQDVEKLIDKNDTSVQIAVELAKVSEHHQSGDIFKVEFNLHTAQGNSFVVGEGATLYAAIDQAKDELLGELRVVKRKRLHLLRRGGARIKEMLRGWRGVQ